jgi:hypothetical protein
LYEAARDYSLLLEYIASLTPAPLPWREREIGRRGFIIEGL